MLLAPSVAGLFKWRQFEHCRAAAWFSALSMLPSDPGRRAGRILRVKDHEVLTMKCNEKAVTNTDLGTARVYDTCAGLLKPPDEKMVPLVPAPLICINYRVRI
jgi:hypothetical protein